ncbi:hypothetical protein ACFV4E_26975 [Streptomyces hygroscopicus]|uniref:hypothetical protein n=1 Tax=Streptomyces hygroscopicus TaxID=1912 RepID=UPI003683C778
MLAHRDDGAAFTARQAAVELRWPEGRTEEMLESIAEVRLLDIVADGDQLGYRYRPLVRLFAREQPGPGYGPGPGHGTGTGYGHGPGPGHGTGYGPGPRSRSRPRTRPDGTG